MKTIEERANEYAETISGYEIIANNGYYQGATQQRQIDINEICNWILENVDDTYITDYGYDINRQRLITDLRKALED